MKNVFWTLLSVSIFSILVSCTNGTLYSGTFGSGSGGPSPSPFPITNILGQTSSTTIGAGTGAAGMGVPDFMAFDGTHLAVSDTTNNRVLIWNEIPLSFDQPADLVIGQTSFIITTPNQGGGAGPGTLSSPRGLAIYNGQLIVADSNNSRVLIWSTFPTANGQSASYVIGQNNFIGTAGGITQTTLSSTGINGIAIDPSGGLYLADTGNSRVLYYSQIPTSNGAAATYVVGQGNFLTSGGTTSQLGLNSPWGVSTNGNYLAVADTANNRVMIYSVPLVLNAPAAIAVIGQGSYNSATPGCTASTISGPVGVYFRGINLYVSDTNNNRVLLFTSPVSTFSQAATGVFGQTNFLNFSASTTQTTFSGPMGLFSDQWGNLWVTDSQNNRLTINPWL